MNEIHSDALVSVISLSQGKFTIVDTADYEFLSKYKWCFHNGYALKTFHTNGSSRTRKTTSVYMHRLIMNTPEGMDTDHANGDKLDNRRCNLRICTRKQNNCNQRPIRGGSSKYKGVSWCKIRNNWIMRINVTFPSEIEAALAYNEVALKFYAEYANLNIINDGGK